MSRRHPVGRSWTSPPRTCNGYRRPRSRTATVQVSQDGGKTWRSVAVTRTGPGRFRAVFSDKSAGPVALRVTAAVRPAARSKRPSCPPTRSPDRKHGAAPHERFSVFRCLLATPPGGPPGPWLWRCLWRRRPGGRHPGRERRGRPVRTAGAPACRRNEGGLCARPSRVRPVLRPLGAAGQRQPGDRRRDHRCGRHPEGVGAKALESAYKLPVSRHPHQTVAVTIAYRTPHLAHYLAVYRKEYGMPACTSAGGCFRVVNQNGRTSPLPSPAGAAAGTWRSPWTFR